MSRIVYVNGRYVPYAQAAVHVEDRGFQFADGIYEVCEVRGGHLVDEARHMARLTRSLGELQIAQPMHAAALAHVMRQVIQPQPRAQRPRLPAGDARRRPARVLFPRRRRAADRRVPGALDLAGTGRRQRGNRHRRKVDARHPLAALRYQDGHAAAGLPRQGGGAQGRGARGVVRRPGWPRHRGCIEQRLDRRSNLALSSPGHWAPISCPA